ncbi:YihY/virulence factor BrkB family protein [Marinactinospora thermotolerans]|uniref:Membrane protein n=1 Tax=Marinactinospora thermotolerans DSM 45154 TaxID=1122192 RepID=A0A1T4S7D0_9ACTN|nr:YihY/virulence factor BrkB family protein [Marinactinospora thermotolerans]SKA24230.1 membrane protein [Marinactinospora thermotolerans DSM 45154]
MRVLAERARRYLDDLCIRNPRLGAVVSLVARTAASASRTRVVGLAAESAFFSLLSLPALLLGLVGALGHLRPLLGAETVLGVREWILELAATALTTDTVDTVVTPLVDDFLAGAQGGAISVTFLVSLWSGSRAMNVFIESITIAYGLEELRGYFRQRALAFVGYLGGLLFALVVLPAIVAGPELVRDLLPMTADHLHLAYWPGVVALSLLCLVGLYTLSVPVRTPVWRHLPGAVVAVLVLLAGSVLLRLYLDASFGQVTIYGSLAAPIAILAWLWVMALAVLVGSSLNAEIDAMWPTETTATARAEIAARRHARAARLVERREKALQSVAGEEGEADVEPAPENDRPERGETVAAAVPTGEEQRQEGEEQRQEEEPADEGAETPPSGPVARAGEG